MSVVFFITGRKEVVAKVLFLHLSVILFTGGVCLSACWDTPREQTPPGADTPQSRQPPQSRHPPGADTPRSRHPPGADTPPRSRHPPEQTPPGSRHPPPPRKQTPAYGLQAAGTHPTGMHYCLDIFMKEHTGLGPIILLISYEENARDFLN